MGRRKKSIKIFFFLFLVLIAGVIWYWYNFLRDPVIKNGGRYLYVSREDSVEDISEKVFEAGFVTSQDVFLRMARKYELNKNLHPGRYYIRKNAHLKEIIFLIIRGKEDPVELVIPSVFHSMEEFVRWMKGRLDLKEEELEEWFLDEKKYWDYFELMKEEALGMLVPGKITIGWAPQPEEFFKKFKTKFDSFWNSMEVKEKLKRHPLTRNQIITLASIVQCETAIASEQRKIAGVYINRLNKGMLLQADPTLIFATGNWGKQRVYNKDKEVDSPYNTYKYPGLPPGPICNPLLSAIRSVLDYEKHNFYYFCSKPDMNGYSNYSKTYQEHQKYALEYQKKLNELNIR